MGVGFVIAFTLGMGTGLAIAFSRPVDRFVSPIIVTSQAVPKVALTPLFAVWFGLGLKSIIAIAAAIAFFPIVINVALGFKGIDPDFVRLGTAMGASRWGLFSKVRFPDALPSIFVATKLDVLFSVIGVIVGEFVMGSEGPGLLGPGPIRGLEHRRLVRSYRTARVRRSDPVHRRGCP